MKLWLTEELGNEVQALFAHIPFERVSEPKDADFLLVGRSFTSNKQSTNVKWLNGIIELSNAHKKPYIAFLVDDPDERMAIGNGILFRTSFLRSQRGPVSMPAFINCDKLPNSTVYGLGFCGLPNHLRRDAMRQVQGDFISRKMFYCAYSDKEREAHAAEFKDNMLRNSHQLCIRGAGNFSFRFYETMAYGRIPVTVDTDLPLPCSDKIHWPDLIVMAESIYALEKRIKEFNNTHDIPATQNRCRYIWEQYLSYPGFGNYVKNYLNDYINNGNRL